MVWKDAGWRERCARIGTHLAELEHSTEPPPPSSLTVAAHAERADDVPAGRLRGHQVRAAARAVVHHPAGALIEAPDSEERDMGRGYGVLMGEPSGGGSR